MGPIVRDFCLNLKTYYKWKRESTAIPSFKADNASRSCTKFKRAIRFRSRLSISDIGIH